MALSSPPNRASRTSSRVSFVNKAFAVIACGAVAAVAACSTASVKLGALPAEHGYADSLIVSLEDVRHIANFEGLAPYSYADRHQPSEADVNAPGPCRAVGSSSLTFTAGWKEFRAVAYSGTTDDLQPGGIAPINQVSHAVAVYSDARAAHAALDRLELTLNECASLHNSDYDFSLNKPDTSTLKLSSAGWSHVYQVKSSVLVSVGVLGIEPTEQVANTVLRTVTDRIKQPRPPQSSAAQDSMITRAIEIDPGRSSFDSDELLQSPASSAARTSSRVNHFASAISPSLNEKSSAGSASAWKPTISERGNGQG
jgi:PknH-like extracellular domain